MELLEQKSGEYLETDEPAPLDEQEQSPANESLGTETSGCKIPVLDREHFFTRFWQLSQARRCLDSPPERWYAALYQVFTDLTRLRGWTCSTVLFLDPASFPDGLLGPLCDSSHHTGKSSPAGNASNPGHCCYCVRCCIIGTPPTNRLNRMAPENKALGTIGGDKTLTSENEIVIPVPIHASLTLANIDTAMHVSRRISSVASSHPYSETISETGTIVSENESSKASIILGFVDNDSTTAFYRIQEGVGDLAASDCFRMDVVDMSN